jgi:hypothetical protein
MFGNPGWIEQYPDPLIAAVSGNTVNNYYVLQHNIRAESSTPSTIGTLQFYDFRGFCPTCPLPTLYTVDINRYDLKIAPMFFPGSYTSTSGAGTDCNVDMTSHPNTGANAAAMHWELLQTGEITNPAPANYTTGTIWTQGWGDIPNLVPIAPGGIPSFQVQGVMQQMRIEVDQPVRGDLNQDGVVTFADFSLFAGDWAKADLCGCGNYWPGQQMP